MLSKKYRFHSRGGVRYVYKNGKTVRRSKASLVFCDNERGFTRVSVVVSKKVNKSAVGRNRIRRRVYEVIRKNFELVPKGRDYIFVIFSKEFLKMKNAELETILGELVQESKIS
ncbi:MAG: ribonuclease P protein component [Candidatus Saccharibacteria bacterium]|nr:ribonuclease P protein component [Candidatus Saccharibacteria bacterium]